MGFFGNFFGSSSKNQKDTYYENGVKNASEGNFTEAQNQFNKSLDFDESYRPPKDCLKVIDDLHSGRVIQEAAIQLFKGIGYYDNLIMYGDNVMKDSNYKKAILHYEKAIDYDPNYARSYMDLGVLYGQSGDHGKAITEFEKACKIEPEFGQAHYNLSYAYYQNGQYNLAKEHCDIAAQLGFEVPASYYNQLSG